MPPDARLRNERRAGRDTPAASGFKTPFRRRRANRRRARASTRAARLDAARERSRNSPFRSRRRTFGSPARRGPASFEKPASLRPRLRGMPTGAPKRSHDTRERRTRTRKFRARGSRFAAKLARAATQLAKEIRAGALGRVVGITGQRPLSAQSLTTQPRFPGPRRGDKLEPKNAGDAFRNIPGGAKKAPARRGFGGFADREGGKDIVLDIRADSCDPGKCNNVYDLLPTERTPLPARTTPPNAWRARPLRLPASEDRATFDRTKRGGYGEDARRPLNGRLRAKIRKAFARLRRCRTKVDSRLRSTTDRQRFSTTQRSRAEVANARSDSVSTSQLPVVARSGRAAIRFRPAVRRRCLAFPPKKFPAKLQNAR